MAAEVSARNAEVRRALQHKYRWLFVDEFQDTDPVQAEIMFLLAADEPRSRTHPLKPADWRTVALRPGALFVVGDPKQSIYRFRRADIEIYNHVRARLAQSTRALIVPLTTNFRSVPSAVRVGERGLRAAVPRRQHAFAHVRAARTASRQRVGRSVMAPNRGGDVAAGSRTCRVSAP